MDLTTHDISTIAAHAGLSVPMGETISTVGPIAASTTFTHGSVDETHAALDPDVSGFAYGRNANPTVVALEQSVAAISGSADAVAFGSGMAAIHAALAAVGLGEGDRIVASRDLYGATRGLFGLLGEHGVEVEYVDILDEDEVERAISPAAARVLYFESIANPLLQVPAIVRLADLARRHRAVSILDNTFASPVLFRGAEHGIDLEVQSATKFLSGHGDVTGGLVAGSAAWMGRVRSLRTTVGAILSPFEAWLTMRGMRTLVVRMERQCDTAAALATWLQQQAWVERVHYPGLDDQTAREAIGQQFGGRFGALVTAQLAGEPTNVSRFMDALNVIISGTSLGDASSLITCPRLSSHRGLSEEEADEAGIRGTLVRISVGLEKLEDLQADLTQAARSVLSQADGQSRASFSPPEFVR